MDSTDSPDVLEEVEALFKKLQHLPESIRQKALSCIQEKLPDSKTPRILEDVNSKSSSKYRKGSSPRKLPDAAPTPSSVRVSLRKRGLSKESASESVSEPNKTVDDNAVEVAPNADNQEETGNVEADQTILSSRDEKTKALSKIRTKKEKVGSTVPQDETKSLSFIDEESQAVLVEDIRTLHGRRTKRINVANLIRGVRKPKLQTSQTKTVATVPKAKEVVIEKVSPRNIFRKNVPVPSDVAESAEILASLSNEISQKDLSQGIILNVNVEQTDCLKDKTNNQESEDVSNTVALSSEEEPQVVNIKLESANVNEENASFDDEAHDDEAISDPLIEDDEDVGNSETEESEFSCHFCEFKTKTKFALAVHVKKHKENIPKSTAKTSSKTLYACTECNKTFSQACGLQLHIKRHRNERDFACPDCDYKAYTKVDLTRHQTIHTGERNKVCEFCGKAFAKDSTLRDHVRAIHERKVRHECEVCGFVTHRANNLRVHIRMRHHGEYNNHVCPVCNASVKQKNAFLEHMRSHTGERPYKCEECTASFACLARLNVHRNAVHGERLFKCGDCDKSFQTKHHLLRHHAIHTKERPYACPYCSYACNTQGNIAKHVRSIHNFPDFSYRKYKLLQENGGQLREVDPEWVRKGEEVTKEYLNSLSSKLGRQITLDELWDKEKELQKKKEEQEKARLAQKEQRAAKAETGGGTSFLSRVRKRPTGSRKGKSESQSSSQDDPDDPQILIQDLESAGDEDGSTSDLPFYKLVSQTGNIQLCLETDEVQVYTGDATRELSLLQMKNDGTLADGEEIQTIQGYMNEHGQFVRLDEGAVVGEDSSTVVVIIDSELSEGLTPEVADVMEVTCEEATSNVANNKRSIECDVPMSQDSKRKKSVIRIIKEELPD